MTMHRPARILVADDVALNREFLGRPIRQLGHEVILASDGAEALDLLRAAPVDLLLLDIVMPVKDGYEVLETMRRDQTLRHVPVIVISAVEEMESVVRCVQLGAEDYLFKPFNPVLLRARLEACLEKKRLRDDEQRLAGEVRRERERSENLLRSILPAAIAQRLKDGATTIADSFPAATVLFADLHDFARLSAGLTPPQTVLLLNAVFSAFERLAERHGVEKIKTIGDAFMAVAGVPVPRDDHAAAAAMLALAMQQELPRLTLGLPEPPSLRIGIHSGPVVAGVIGTTRLAYDVWGDTVTVAAQMEAFGLPGSIQISDAARTLIEPDFHVEERGSYYVKGEGELTTYLLLGRRH